MATARQLIIVRKLSYLRKGGATQTNRWDTIRAVAPKYGQVRAVALGFDPIGSASRHSGCFSHSGELKQFVVRGPFNPRAVPTSRKSGETWSTHSRVGVLPETSMATRSRVEFPSYRLQHFRSRAGCLRFNGSDGNSQDASCFADRKMIHIPQVKRSPQFRR